MVNKRNMRKRALSLDSDDKPAQWTSLYGSVTFHQHGRELPLGGINEKGLVVEILWLDDTEYPDWDNRPTVTELQWIQYQLDKSSSLEEAVSAAKQIRVTKAYADVHYFICDKGGSCGTFEFLDGELVMYFGSKLPFPGLTNTPYFDSLDFLREHKGFGGSKKIPAGFESLDRFVRLAHLVQHSNPLPRFRAIDTVLGALGSVRDPDSWRWNIAYELNHSRIHIRQSRDKKLRSISWKDFDFSCSKAVRVFDMGSPEVVNITSAFKDYSTQFNKDLVELGLKDISSQLPAVGS
jgi:choloylglycine hydrolase